VGLRGRGACVISSKRQNPLRRRQWRVACSDVMEINSFQSTSRAQSVSTGGSCSYYIIIIIISIIHTTTTAMCIYDGVAACMRIGVVGDRCGGGPPLAVAKLRLPHRIYILCTVSCVGVARARIYVYTRVRACVRALRGLPRSVCEGRARPYARPSTRPLPPPPLPAAFTTATVQQRGRNRRRRWWRAVRAHPIIITPFDRATPP